MDNRFEQFLRDILVEDMDNREIRAKAYDLLMANKAGQHRLYDGEGNSVFLDTISFNELVDAIKNRGKIASIKYLRSMTGLSLISSKKMVENLAVFNKIDFN